MTTFIRSAAFSALVLVSGAFLYAPIHASAQVSSCGFYGNYNTSCGTGTVLVYVQVINNQNASYTPSNFQVQISGQSASPSTFAGSQNGTLVTLTGGSGYSVTVPQSMGYTPSYSAGCSGIAYANQQATCVVTMSGSSNYSTFPQPYPYNPYTFQYSALTCYPSYQSIPLGQTANLTATGGTGTIYNWSIPGRSYQGTGQVLNIGFQTTGTQLVTVENGSQIATCTVRVTDPGTPAYIGGYNNPVTPGLQATYVPRLPNTGFEPISATGIAFGTIVLLGLGVYLYPYARKALAVAVR